MITPKSRIAIQTSSLVLFVVLLGGCASIFSKSADEIKIESEPAEAKVYLDGQYIGATPLTQKIDRETFASRVLMFKKEGYETKRVRLEKTLNKTALWNFGFITTTFGATSWGIDALSGAMIEYSPKFYIVELQAAKKGDDDQANFRNQDDQTLLFVLQNYDQLKRDLARGDGEYLRNYYQLKPNAATYREFVSRLWQAQDILLMQLNGLEFYRVLKKI